MAARPKKPKRPGKKPPPHGKQPPRGKKPPPGKKLPPGKKPPHGKKPGPPEEDPKDKRRAWTVGLVLLLCLAAVGLWMATRPGADDVPGLIRRLMDADPQVQAEASRQIVDIGYPAVPVLLKTLDTEAIPRRAAVAAFFGNRNAIAENPEPFRGPDVREALARAVRSEHWVVRGSALMGHLLRSPWDEDVAERVLTIQAEAMHVLSRRGKKIIDTDRDAAEEARRAASVFAVSIRAEHVETMPVFLDGLESDDHHEVGFSIVLLGRLGPAAESALPALEALFEEQAKAYPLSDPRTWTKRRVDPECHLDALEKALALIRPEESPGEGLDD